MRETAYLVAGLVLLPCVCVLGVSYWLMDRRRRHRGAQVYDLAHERRKRRAAGTLLLLTLTGCDPYCHAALVGDDVVITARHCVDFREVPTRAPAGTEPLQVGDEVSWQGCGATRTGTVLDLDPPRVHLSGPACPGDSGGPVTRRGELVGIIVRRTIPGGLAVAEVL